ncbi:ABC transporter ATP-binding protein [Pseudoflavonifractor sp. 524-17]|uniref:ABC transporter ATP-binding protein n=1 Tax=Pseudoflavonifractor sp. 524-17 TaxID=2304577 RepID=UPI001379EAEB|nr:ABC transporter ATP-binding protein [Pseudoflavonifractor sp. 524-17]NCE63265.1 ABC transporter ATP-binding protein [Pseudoflavonifractor sp. 524-17]
MSDQPLLEVKDLKVSFHTYAGQVQAVRGLSFSLSAGETLAVVGESGCGKSVSAKALMGLLSCPPCEIKPASQILYQGKNVLQFQEAEWSAFRGKECSMIFQDALAALNPTLAVGRQIEENLIVHHLASRSAARKKAVEMLALVGIPQPERRARQYPHQFSGGMRQRVMIAIALACDPKILIADEPTTALDVTIQAQIIDLIKALQGKLNTAVLLITHDLGVVADIAHRILVVYAGRIVEQGSRDEIFYSHRHPYTWSLLRSVPRLDLTQKEELVSIEGTPPDLIDPPAGCPFAGRCRWCMEICREEEPPEVQFSPGHSCRCWLHHPDAPDWQTPFQRGDGVLC